MAFVESENLKLKIQDDDEFCSIVPTAENFQKVDKAFEDVESEIAGLSAATEKNFQYVEVKINQKAAASHRHTASEVEETSDRKFMTGADVSKLGSIANGATKNIVDSALSDSSTNCVENRAVAAGIKKVSDSLASHSHTAAQISETSDKKIMTAAERTKLSGVATGATKNVVDSELSDSSSNAVANNAVAKKMKEIEDDKNGIGWNVFKLILLLSAEGGMSDGDDGSTGAFSIGDELIQWGTITKANAAENTVETVSVKFKTDWEYANGKYVAFAMAMSSVPQKVSVGATGRSATGFKINHWRTTTDASTIVWLTIGRAKSNTISEALSDS